jgi:hypothetical protein
VKKIALATMLLATASTSAFAWTDQFGHWQEGPGRIVRGSPFGPAYVPYPSPYYNPGPVVVAPPPCCYGPPPAVYGPPVVVVPPETAMVQGIFGIIGAAIAGGRRW